MWINGMYILDYPARLTTEPLTEERKKRIKEAEKIMREFVAENNIEFKFGDDDN